MAANVDFARKLVHRYPGSARLDAFASLGRTDKSHAERDFHRWLGTAKELGVSPYNLKVMLKTRCRLRPVECKIPVIPIHLLLRACYNAGPNQWAKTALGNYGPTGLRDYWAKAQDLDWARAHPGVQRLKAEGRLDKTAPLLFHQDGVETFRTVEANVFSLQSALSYGNTIDTKLLIGFVWEACMPTKALRQAVNEEFCDYVDYCAKACEEGVGPLRGFYGEENPPCAGEVLFGDYRAVYAGWKGDMKARKKEHAFTRAWDCTWVCSDCAACQPYSGGIPELTYTRVHPNALWKRTRISHEAYMLTDGRSPWARVRGFHLKTVYRDVDHIMFLGFCRDVAGSMLYEFAQAVLSLGFCLLNLDDALKWLYISYVEWCKERRVTYTPQEFSLQMLGKTKQNEYPVLSSQVKAAHCKVLMYFIAYMSMVLDSGTQHDRVRTVCACALADCFNCLDQSGMWLSDAMATWCANSGELFLMAYVHMAAAALSAGVTLWKVRPKMHDFQEQLERLKYDKYNLLYHQCLNDEHMLGIFKRITRGCHIKSANYRLAHRYLGELMRLIQAQR